MLENKELEISPEDIPYEPMGPTILIYWANETKSGIILPETSMPTELLVAKVGPDVKTVKPGDRIMVAGTSYMFMKIDGRTFVQVYESSVKGKILKPGAVHCFDPTKGAVLG